MIQTGMITVTANPCFDRTIHIGSFQFDDPNRVKSEFVEASGKGVNLSILFEKFGLTVPGLILAGKENYGFYRSLLPASLDLHPVYKKGSIRENLTICSEDGKLIKINRKGEICSPDEIACFQKALAEAANPGTIVILSDSMPPGLDRDAFTAICLELKKKGCRLAIDSEILDGRMLEELQPFVIKPNAEEFGKLTGADPENLGDVIAKARELCAFGLGQVLVSLGGRGLLGIQTNRVVWAKPPKVKVASTVAAGDSSLAGFLLHSDEDFGSAVGWGAAFGTAAVTLEGSGVPDPALAEEIHHQVVIEEL